MLPCLQNYISIKGCGLPESGSGFYINQLAGINLRGIDRIADDEQVTFKGVWDDVHKRANRRFVKDFTREFNSRYTALCCKKDCTIDDLICKVIADFTDALLYVHGNELMIERLFSPRLNSYTTVNKDEAYELRDHYQLEYEKELARAVKSIPKAMIEDCFECTGNRIQSVQRLP